MSVSERFRNTLGILAVLASLALASPGVRVVKAEPVAASASEAGGQCPAADAGAAARASQVQDFLARVRAEQAQAGQPGESDGPNIIVLNNRGYNYGSGSPMALDQVLIDAQRERR